MSDEYSCVAKGKLKLKNDGETLGKRKKSKKNKVNGNDNTGHSPPRSKRQRPTSSNKEHEEHIEDEQRHSEDEALLLKRISTERNTNKSSRAADANVEVPASTRRFTKAELAFRQQQQAMVSVAYHLGWIDMRTGRHET